MAASGASWMYRLTASEPHRPISCIASKEYPIRDRNWAPETRHTCSPKRGKGSPLGPGLVRGVSVSPMAEEKIFMMWALVAKSPVSVGISGRCSGGVSRKRWLILFMCRCIAWKGHSGFGSPVLQVHGCPRVTQSPVGSFFCTGRVKYTNLVMLVSWNQMCWKRAAAASIPLSIHQHAIKVMSRAANRSLNQSPLRVISSRRWRGTWKSSSSKASLKGVGPWPRLMLRRIFCIKRWRSGGMSCPRVSRCTWAAL